MYIAVGVSMGVVAVGTALAVWWLVQRAKRWNVALDAVARRYRLKATIFPSSPESSSAEGLTEDGFDLRISRDDDYLGYDNLVPYYEVTVCPRWLDIGMSVIRKGSSPQRTVDYSQTAPATGTGTGYPEIDRDFDVSDPHPVVIEALADPDTRAAFVAFLAGGGMMDSGDLTYRNRKIPLDAAPLLQGVDAVLGLAGRLFRPEASARPPAPS